MRHCPAVLSPGERNRRPDYRPDIDGLRAVAILSVVVYHLAPEALPAGFLGVDIFFAISGFLISTIIFKSLETNGFSFAEFYAHRIRRLFPALILVIAFCLIVGWRALLPSEFKRLATHIVASSTYMENFRLKTEAGYFDVSTTLKPLMHLWSLAVEEQFYLVFPLLMWFGWRLRLNLLLLVAVIFSASLGWFLYKATSSPVAAFFFPQYRFWELMAGALLAHASLKPWRGGTREGRATPDGSAAGRSGSAKISALSVIGLGLVGLAISGVQMRLPAATVTGEALAVSGSTLLLFTGPNGLINRVLLSSRLAVSVGLISYPLYLWHWPLLSFLTIIDGNFPPFGQRALAISISVVLAVMTYQFIELPIRRRRHRRAAITLALVAASAALLVLGGLGRVVTPHYDEATAKIIAASTYVDYPTPPAAYVDAYYQVLAIGNNSQNKIFFLGDSHAKQYFSTIGQIYEDSPWLGDRVESLYTDRFQDSYMSESKDLLDKILKDDGIKSVVFSEFWAIQRTSPKINYAIRCCGSGLMQMVGTQPARFSEGRIAEINRNLVDLIGSLRQAGKDVYLILDNPFGEELAPRSLLERSFFHPIEISIAPLSTKDALARDEPVRSSIIEIAQETGAKLIDPMASACDQLLCPALAENGEPMYRDYDHFSSYTLTHEVHYLDFLFQPRSGTP